MIDVIFRGATILQEMIQCLCFVCLFCKDNLCLTHPRTVQLLGRRQRLPLFGAQ